MKANPRPEKSKGFALVIATILMVLLVILAVGLLSLSTVTLRSTGQGEGRARAQANARLGLMLALGELQTHAGPDTRITATGSITGDADKSKEHITGVWDSWKIDPNNLPNASDYQANGGKQQKFKKWLVSNPDVTATEELDFASTPAPEEKERVTLVPGYNSGSSTVHPVYGGRVPVKGPNNQPGSYAFAVLDEGVKARLDTGFKPVTQTTLGDLATTLATGSRPDVGRIPGLEKIDWTAADISKADYKLDKALSFPSVALLLGGKDKTYESLVHDVSTSSLGVFSDAANGGLKQDLNSILNGTALPSDLAGTTNSKMYSKHLEMSLPTTTTNGQLEPSWQQLFRLASTHKNTSILKNSNGPTLTMQPPTLWNSSTQPPPVGTHQTVSLMPSLVKMQIFYSIIAVPLARDGNLTTKPSTNDQWTDSEAGLVGWASTAWDKGARYFMMICMSPVVTLQNPYNVNLTVNRLSVELTNVPIAIQIERQMGGGATSGWVPAKGQGADNIDTESKERPKSGGRRYTFDLTNSPGVPSFTMAPGEVRMFSPTLPTGGRTSYTDNPYRSWNNFTDPSSAQPMTLEKGFRGVTIGFYAPRIAANELQGYESYPNPDTENLRRRNSLEYLGPNDRIRARIRPCLDARISSTSPVVIEKGKTKVALIQTQTTAGATAPVYSVMNINVGTTQSGNLLTGLETALNLPETGQEVSWANAADIAIASGAAPLNASKAYTFGLATMSAKTTYGNHENKKDDGVVAAKPMAFHSAAGLYNVVDVSKYGLEPYPYEAGAIALDSSLGTGFEEYLEANSFGRTYAVTGLRANRGQQFGTVYEVPVGPLQNFSQLNAANLASNTTLARFTNPIGNSWAHPMIPPDTVKGAINSLDHSFLLNSLLYDKYYFSGIAARQGGAFLTAATTENLAKNFLQSAKEGPSLDKRLVPYLPDGETEDEAVDTLIVATDTDAQKPQARYQAASHQLMKGAFNVNSTSKLAWKAMLASLHAPNAKMFKVDETASAAVLANLKGTSGSQARFSRFSVPNSDAAEDATEDQKVFQGPRDIDEAQLDSLADEIVKQVRLRGPFLSMAEFVNRQLGSSALAQKGALQAAIDATRINASNSVLENTGYELPSGLAKYTNPKAMEGRSDQGAPGYVTQGDLLATLGNAATVRSDTFTVRAYGDARDATGKIIARAWCEAVVQRMPEYISPEDRSHVAPAALTSQSNRTFGRKFSVISFRWLAPIEVTDTPATT